MQNKESITAKSEGEQHHHPYHLFTDGIMKTLCFTLGLLLLTVCCCDAVGEGAFLSTAPGDCCFSFYGHRVPPKFIVNITKTHSSCLHKAFILKTARGNKICYRQSFQWALDTYNKLYNTKSGNQKP